jgi:hypothetical protein
MEEIITGAGGTLAENSVNYLSVPGSSLKACSLGLGIER